MRSSAEMKLHRLAKLHPQPDENGLFAIGSVPRSMLDNDNYLKEYDKTMDVGPVVVGVWLAELSDKPIGSLKQGKFSPAPDEFKFMHLESNCVCALLIDNEWWWVQYMML